MSQGGGINACPWGGGGGGLQVKHALVRLGVTK